MIAKGQRNRLGPQAGFTLIEVLIAIAIVAAIFGVMTTTIKLIGKGTERSRMQAAFQDMLMQGFDALTRDLAAIQRVPELRDKALLYLFEGSAASLTYPLVEPPYPGQSGLYLVHLAVTKAKGKSRLTRTRAPLLGALKGQQAGAFGDEAVVLEGLFDIRFSYAEAAPREITWRDHWDDGQKLPSLIKVDLFDPVDRVHLPPLIVRLMIDGEPGCAKAGGGICAAATNGRLKSSAKPGDEGKSARPKPE
jgi:prepilin-type N-terminal cleavage/methylation domain-containing protein